MRKKDLTGQRFGRLTVIEEAPPQYTPSGIRKVMWWCICDCNPDNKIAVHSTSLIFGKTKSCGCYNKERIKQSRHKQCCTYDLSGDFGIGYTQKGDEFWFDKEDYELISQYNWFKHHNYFEAHIPMTKPKKTIQLHRLIMGTLDTDYKKIVVDHINSSNKFDNRKCNLRIADRTQNNINKIKQKNNVSGITGVRFRPERDVWIATINVNKKQKYWEFKTFEEAIAKRKEMEKLYYGDYSYENSQNIAKNNNIKEVK